MWFGGPWDGKEVAVGDDAALTLAAIAPCNPSLSIDKPGAPEAPTIRHYPLRRSADGRWWVFWRER